MTWTTYWIQKIKFMILWNIKSAKSTTPVLLFKKWYFGHTGWSSFQTFQIFSNIFKHSLTLLILLMMSLKELMILKRFLCKSNLWD